MDAHHLVVAEVRGWWKNTLQYEEEYLEDFEVWFIQFLKQDEDGLCVHLVQDEGGVQVHHYPSDANIPPHPLPQLAPTLHFLNYLVQFLLALLLLHDDIFLWPVQAPRVDGDLLYQKSTFRKISRIRIQLFFSRSHMMDTWVASVVI